MRTQHAVAAVAASFLLLATAVASQSEPPFKMQWSQMMCSGSETSDPAYFAGKLTVPMQVSGGSDRSAFNKLARGMDCPTNSENMRHMSFGVLAPGIDHLMASPAPRAGDALVEMFPSPDRESMVWPLVDGNLVQNGNDMRFVPSNATLRRYNGQLEVTAELKTDFTNFSPNSADWAGISGTLFAVGGDTRMDLSTNSIGQAGMRIFNLMDGSERDYGFGDNVTVSAIAPDWSSETSDKFHLALTACGMGGQSVFVGSFQYTMPSSSECAMLVVFGLDSFLTTTTSSRIVPVVVDDLDSLFGTVRGDGDSRDFEMSTISSPGMLTLVGETAILTFNTSTGMLVRNQRIGGGTSFTGPLPAAKDSRARIRNVASIAGTSLAVIGLELTQQDQNVRVKDLSTDVDVYSQNIKSSNMGSSALMAYDSSTGRVSSLQVLNVLGRTEIESMAVFQHENSTFVYVGLDVEEYFSPSDSGKVHLVPMTTWPPLFGRSYSPGFASIVFEMTRMEGAYDAISAGYYADGDSYSRCFSKEEAMDMCKGVRYPFGFLCEETEGLPASMCSSTKYNVASDVCVGCDQ